MFPITIPVCAGRPVKRIDMLEGGGEVLVTETPTLIGSLRVAQQIIRLPQKTIDEWDSLVFKKQTGLFLNYLLWTLWRLTTVLAVCVSLALVTWSFSGNIELSIVVGFVILWAGEHVADLCELSQFRRMDTKIRDSAKRDLQKILTENGYPRVVPNEVGSLRDNLPYVLGCQ